MLRTRAPQLTTVELMDALEARIAAIPRRNGDPAPGAVCSVTPAALRAEMEQAGVSPVDLARAVGVPYGELDGWLNGDAAIPCWLLSATRLFALLTPSARRKLLTGARENGHGRPNKTHPFSRIEDL